MISKSRKIQKFLTDSYFEGLNYWTHFPIHSSQIKKKKTSPYDKKLIFYVKTKFDTDYVAITTLTS